ncbi:similar to Saccharomyces cerevisiae YOL083W ATG34 Receptor protein involved in selective autophagy during starvation [Maudiozyma saulgeensis]|uniref:Similar to Saccharomyces cerevisiae YOL083W ATG34 Receptor protein involved in selective autophagy during starvation n=1 Tax=Maudiozyma saulgeensis TaxID=1789683 RepID=A0A1X7R6L5_9SACH|nr:similar to Saccharomyces cerevisiae YOL083W ATG34 Receptor protein involved in selective autophagy during starvation [Kazachstania saulgeensis]
MSSKNCEQMNEYKVVVEYNSDRIVSYLPNGLFPKGILENSNYFSHVACKLKQLEISPVIEFYHKSKQWRSLNSEKDYCHAAVTLLSTHMLFVSIKEKDYKVDEVGGVMVSRELLTSLTSQMAQLELSLRQERLQKTSTKDDIYFDIDPQNNELFEFYSNIKSSEDLENIMKSYQKYQNWIQKFNNDEKYLENQLENMLVLTKHPIVPSLSKETSSKKLDSMEKQNIPNKNTNTHNNNNNNYPFTLTIYEKDLNFCFKLKNNTDIYFPNKLNIVTNLDGGSYVISVPHGIGPRNQRVFTRFKREFGSDCQISDFMYFQIKDIDEKTVLYEGIRSKFDNEQSIFKLRSVNHLTLSGINLEKLQKHNSTPSPPSVRSSVDAGDIISTTISSNLNESTSGRTFDEYDFLSETEFEDY